MKTCKQCGVEKPLEAFHPAPKCLDGVRPVCRDCIATERRAKHAANPEASRERDRKRYAEDPERRAQQRATAKAFYETNRERQKELRTAYYRENREKWRKYRATRRARRKTDHEPWTRREIYDRDRGHCAICEAAVPYEPGGFHIDHVIPLFHGGADAPSNLQLTCPACNWAKGWITEPAPTSG